MQVPTVATILWWAGVAGALVGVHLLATHGSGTLEGNSLSRIAITPATTLTHWWRHLWAGFFHTSWAHLTFNLAVFTLAMAFATRDQPAWATLANALWIGPLTVFVLHLVLVLPLATTGVPYAIKALDIPLVGFSVMAYSMGGMALVVAPPMLAGGLALLVVALEVVFAIWVTGPFIAVYHLAGFGLGWWVRILWLRS